MLKSVGWTQTLNLVYFLVFALIGAAAQIQELIQVNLIPARYIPYLQAFCAFAMYLKAHANYWTNPDGTSASVGYTPEAGTSISVSMKEKKGE
jgi:hypothetical protein